MNPLDTVHKHIPKEATNFWHDFRTFAFKGNLIDLAIGLIIGTAFNELVQSLVKDIVMPLLGKLVGNVAFSELAWVLSSESFESLAAAEAAGVPIVKYGAFITSMIDFLILALTIFIVLKYILRHQPKEK
jgi:large conductance mechanosensitive channel